MTLSPEQIFGNPQRKILENGLTVLCEPEFTAGLLSVQVWVKTGSIHEGELLGSGLSHYLEHMVFKGTEKFSCAQINKIVQQFGGQMNAYTTFDRTVFHIDLPAESAEVAFDVLSELTLRATISPDDTARERDVILREIDMTKDDPDSVLTEAVLAEIFHVHPHRLPIIGIRSAFENVTRDQLFSYYKKRYVPNNMALVVAGAISPAQTFALAEKYFGMTPAAALGIPAIPEEPQQIAPREVTLFSDVQILRGGIAWKVPGMRHPDSPALSVFATLIGSGQSSRFARKIFEEMNLVHDIDASIWASGETAVFWVWYSADFGKRAAIEDAIHATIADALRDGFSAVEFEKARKLYLAAFLEARKTVSHIAGQLGMNATVIGELNYGKIFYEKIQRLTPAEVLAAAREHLSPVQITTFAMEQKLEKMTPEAASQNAQNAPVPFEETVLENGVRILLQPVSSYPKIHYRATFRAGGICEEKDRRGIAALTATLLARDTKNHTAAEVAEIAETAGASLEEFAETDAIGVSIEVISGDEKLAHTLLADALLRPDFQNDTFARERDGQRASVQEQYDEITSFAMLRLRELFFGEHPFAVNSRGRVADLDALELKNARQFYDKIITPENCIIAVSGAFDRETVLSELRCHFENWHRRNVEIPMTPPLAKPANIGHVEETQPREQAVVFLAFPDSGFNSDERIAAQLLQELFSGMASHLFTTVREERGMAYFIGANRISAPFGGMFYLYAGTSAENVEGVICEMKKEVERFRDGKIDAAEIDAAKMSIRTARRDAQQSPGARTKLASLDALRNRPVNDTAWERILGELDVSSLSAFAQKYFRPENSLTYIVKPEK